METSEHKTANNQVYYTDKYGQFSFIRGNREMSQSRITKIKNAYANGINLFPYCPILVNKKYKIIDGQHRFVAATQLKIPVYFMFVADYDLKQIARINSNSQSWKTKDFLNCYIDLGIKDYKQLEEYIDRFKVPITSALNLLAYGKVSSGGGMTEKFKNGEFRINHMDVAVRVGAIYQDYLGLAAFHKSRALVVACSMLSTSEKYNHEEVFKKLVKNKEKIEIQEGPKDYIAHIELLYNKGNQKRRVIY